MNICFIVFCSPCSDRCVWVAVFGSLCFGRLSNHRELHGAICLPVQSIKLCAEVGCAALSKHVFSRRIHWSQGQRCDIVCLCKLVSWGTQARRIYIRGLGWVKDDSQQTCAVEWPLSFLWVGIKTHILVAPETPAFVRKACRRANQPINRKVQETSHHEKIQQQNHWYWSIPLITPSCLLCSQLFSHVFRAFLWDNSSIFLRFEWNRRERVQLSTLHLVFLPGHVTIPQYSHLTFSSVV